MNSIKSLLGEHNINLPGNGISPTGIELIQGKMMEWEIGMIPTDKVLPPSKTEYWVWDWKVPGKGEYVGSLPKRLSKLVWQVQKIKLTPGQLSEIGNIGSAHSGKHRQYWFDVVDRIEWADGDFGDDGSCYWGNNSGAKEMIEENGGGAIRFYREEDREAGFARAWVVPWDDCWIVFNGYGMETLAIARILSAHLGHSYYRKTKLANNNNASGTLYINGATCYLVGPQESVLEYSCVNLEWEDNTLKCAQCGSAIDGDDIYSAPDGDPFCEECFHEKFYHCESCGETCGNEDIKEIPRGGSWLCEECWDDKYFTCCCNNDYPKGDSMKGLDGETYCTDCWHERFVVCDNCDNTFDEDDIVPTDDGETFCEECHNGHQEKKGKTDLCETISVTPYFITNQVDLPSLYVVPMGSGNCGQDA